MTLELGFPKTLTQRDCTGKHKWRGWSLVGKEAETKSELGLLIPLESPKELECQKRVWSTAGKDQCVKYSNGKFQESGGQSSMRQETMHINFRQRHQFSGLFIEIARVCLKKARGVQTSESLQETTNSWEGAASPILTLITKGHYF